MMVIECKANFGGKDGLKGQKISAQGSALGNHNRQVVGAPCKGKRVIIFIKLLPLQGEFSLSHNKPRALPWADCSLAFR